MTYGPLCWGRTPAGPAPEPTSPTDQRGHPALGWSLLLAGPPSGSAHPLPGCPHRGIGKARVPSGPEGPRSCHTPILALLCRHRGAADTAPSPGPTAPGPAPAVCGPSLLPSTRRLRAQPQRPSSLIAGFGAEHGPCTLSGLEDAWGGGRRDERSVCLSLCLQEAPRPNDPKKTAYPSPVRPGRHLNLIPAVPQPPGAMMPPVALGPPPFCSWSHPWAWLMASPTVRYGGESFRTPSPSAGCPLLPMGATPSLLRPREPPGL